MNNLPLFSELHQYLMSFKVQCTIAGKSLVIGYKPFSFSGIQPKFATLHGSKNYQCLILHIAPKDKQTDLGKRLQKQIQGQLAFDIRELRKFQLKNNEVFIPLEIIDSKDKMKSLREFIQYCYDLRQH